MSSDILIVDDEADIRALIGGILRDEGYATREAGGETDAYKEIAKKPPALIILDIWLQGSKQDGMQILKGIKQAHPLVPIIMISGHGNIETAVAAIKDGAYDFIEKPFKADRLLLMIKRALETAALRRENQTLRQKSNAEYDLIGDSAVMQELRQVLERVAATNSRVLLTGEPGTGKDLAAQMIYRHSGRAAKPFVALNCATLRPDRFEAELFGAYTDAGAPGLLEQANGGTLFLDEVADMPLETQGKIVRVLQEHRFERPGGREAVDVDVRILSATNRDLEKQIEAGRFRQDLYYRLKVVPVHMPALRDHVEDIPALATYFLERIGKTLAMPACTFTPEALVILEAYEWRGNVRQLRNVVEWILIMHGNSCNGVIKAQHLPPDIHTDHKDSASAISHAAATPLALKKSLMALSLKEAREVFEREYMLAQINRFSGHISKMAEFVGMERSALHRKLKSLNISTAENYRKNGGDESDAGTAGETTAANIVKRAS